MIDTNQIDIVGSSRLFLSFLSSTAFYSDRVRCFLQDLQQGAQGIRLMNLPDNLYIASEGLLQLSQPMILAPLLQFPDGSQYPATIFATSKENDWTMLILDLGGIEIVRHLLSDSASTLFNWLTNVLNTGAHMMRVECAQLCFEEQPNQIAQLALNQNRLSLKQLPIILYVSTSLATEDLYSDRHIWKAARQWDGALLLIPNPPPQLQLSDIQLAAEVIDSEALFHAISVVLSLLQKQDLYKLLAILKLEDPQEQYQALMDLLSTIQPDPVISKSLEDATERLHHLMVSTFAKTKSTELEQSYELPTEYK